MKTVAPPASLDTNGSLCDHDLRRMLQGAFSPHRCEARICRDAFSEESKVLLAIQVLGIGSRIGEREFLVEGVPIESLRDRAALLQYIEDVRRELQRRRVPFVQARSDAHSPYEVG